VWSCFAEGAKKSDVAETVLWLCFQTGYKARGATNIRTAAFKGRMVPPKKDSD